MGCPLIIYFGWNTRKKRVTNGLFLNLHLRNRAYNSSISMAQLIWGLKWRCHRGIITLTKRGLYRKRWFASVIGSNRGPDVAGFAIYVCKSGVLGRAHRSHRWGHGLGSCCNHLRAESKSLAYSVDREDGHREPSLCVSRLVLHSRKMDTDNTHASDSPDREMKAPLQCAGYPSVCFHTNRLLVLYLGIY